MYLKSLALIDRICQLWKCIGMFSAINEELETLGKAFLNTKENTICVMKCMETEIVQWKCIPNYRSSAEFKKSSNISAGNVRKFATKIHGICTWNKSACKETHHTHTTKTLLSRSWQHPVSISHSCMCSQNYFFFAFTHVSWYALCLSRTFVLWGFARGEISTGCSVTKVGWMRDDSHFSSKAMFSSFPTDSQPAAIFIPNEHCCKLCNYE